MVGDVVAWLPHSPMLAFDIFPSYGGGIGIIPWLLLALRATPPSSRAMDDDLSDTIFFLISFTGTKKSFL
jgi:hypothetical protein